MLITQAAKFPLTIFYAYFDVEKQQKGKPFINLAKKKGLCAFFENQPVYKKGDGNTYSPII